MTPDQQRHLLELFTACTQETLTETEHRLLQSVLQSDAEARRLWFLHQDLELGLRRLSQVPDCIPGFPESSTFVSHRAESTDVGRPDRLPTRLRVPSRFSAFAQRNAAITTAICLCLFVIVMLGAHFWRQPPAGHKFGIKVGEELAEGVTLESPTHESRFTLSQQKGKLVALHFLLKTECPFCLQHTREYAQLAATTPNVLHVFLKPDSADEIKAWAGKLSQDGANIDPVIYRDPDARLAKLFDIPDGYTFHGQTVHYPALVLLDGAGKELFRYVGKSNADRMSTSDFTSRLLAVTANNGH